MRKMLTMHVFIAMIVSLLFTVSSITPVVADDSITENYMQTYLINGGIPADYVSRLSDERVSELYNNLLGKEFTFTSSPNASTAFPRNGVPANLPDSKLSFDLGIVTEISREAGTNKAIIENIFVDVLYEWNGTPYARDVDAITVNWDGDLFYMRSGSFSATTYQSCYPTEWFVDEDLSSPSQYTRGGIGFTVNMYACAEISLQDYIPTGYYGEASFTLKPRSYPTYSENNLSDSYMVDNIVAEYMHDCSSSSASSYSLDITEDFHVSIIVEDYTKCRQKVDSVDVLYSLP